MSEGGQGGRLVALVTDLLAQLDGTTVTECEFRAGTHHILLRRALTALPPLLRGEPEEEAIPEHWEAITSPLSGICYVTESPTAPPLVSVGVPVTAGQIICLIESMKMFNRVESDRSGIVRAIVVQNGAEVAAGQPLIYLEPVGEGS